MSRLVRIVSTMERGEPLSLEDAQYFEKVCRSDEREACINIAAEILARHLIGDHVVRALRDAIRARHDDE